MERLAVEQEQSGRLSGGVNGQLDYDLTEALEFREVGKVGIAGEKPFGKQAEEVPI
jgi:hypothetical protein